MGYCLQFSRQVVVFDFDARRSPGGASLRLTSSTFRLRLLPASVCSRSRFRAGRFCHPLPPARLPRTRSAPLLRKDRSLRRDLRAAAQFAMAAPPPGSPTSPASPASPSKGKKRVRVHRRPRPPVHKRPFIRALSLFVLIGLLTDFLHPSLPSSVLSAARAGDFDTLALHPACRPTSPPIWTALGLHLSASATTLCWTPSETLTLLWLPPSSGILQASWATLSWTPLEGSTDSDASARSVSLAPLAGWSAGRFRPLAADTRGEPARIVEHARGFVPARMLQSAILEMAVSGSAWPLVRTPANVARESFRYFARVVFPASLHAIRAGGAAAVERLDVPLAGAREIAASCRKRRQQA